MKQQLATVLMRLWLPVKGGHNIKAIIEKLIVTLAT